MDIRSQPFAFDRGLDRIIHGDSAAPALPQQHELAPSELEGVGQLERLFEQRSLEDRLEAAVRPEVSDRDLLLPAAFRAALDRALGTLRDAAEHRPDDARVLNRAARLLKEETDLRDLVAMYRGALYQG